MNLAQFLAAEGQAIGARRLGVQGSLPQPPSPLLRRSTCRNVFRETDPLAPVCGIVGNVLARADLTPEVTVLRRVNHWLVHRGPDDEAFFVPRLPAVVITLPPDVKRETGATPGSGDLPISRRPS
jgi:hypothetical protein